MTTPTFENKQVARIISAAVGGAPRIHRYWDSSNELYVDLLTSQDQPNPGTTTFCTIGLFKYPMETEGKEFPVGIEMIGVCEGTEPRFANILADAAFYLMRTQWFCAPGSVLLNVLDPYENLSATLKHLLFLPPSLWSEHLHVMTIAGRKLTWLQAVPISESERVFLKREGIEAFVDRLEEEQVDIGDLARSSCV